MRKDFPNHKEFEEYECHKCHVPLLNSNVLINQCFCPICYTHFIKREVVEFNK